MKEKMFGMRALLATLVVFVITGCASSLKQHADGTWSEAVTVGDGSDRSGTLFSSYSAEGVDKDGKLVGAKLLKPRDLSVGPTVVGQAAVAVVGGVTTAGTQGLFAVRAAHINAEAGCRGASCGTQVFVQGAQAAAFSASQANAGARANAGGGLSCSTNCGMLGQ